MNPPAFPDCNVIKPWNWKIFHKLTYCFLDIRLTFHGFPLILHIDDNILLSYLWLPCTYANVILIAEKELIGTSQLPLNALHMYYCLILEHCNDRCKHPNLLSTAKFAIEDASKWHGVNDLYLFIKLIFDDIPREMISCIWGLILFVV